MSTTEEMHADAKQAQSRMNVRRGRITEKGDSIGDYHGYSIPAFIITDDGRRYEYDRIAVVDEDGGCGLSQLARSEVVIAPGLIYRLVETADARCG